MKNRESTRVRLVLVVLFGFAGSLLAISTASADEEGIVLEKGRWLFDVAVLMPMETEPATQTLQACMTGEPLTAEKLMPWAESQGCKIRGVRVEANELSWKLNCKMNGQRSRGSGEFKVEGRTGEGEARVSFDMAGRRLSVVTNWQARPRTDRRVAGEDEDEDEESAGTDATTGPAKETDPEAP